MKLIFLAMLLFLWVSPMSMTSTNIVIRVKQNAFDNVSQTQRELVQKALSNISLPLPKTTEKKESGGGVIRRIINNRNIFGARDTLVGKVMNLKEVKIHHVKFPKINVKLVPDVGLHVCMDIDFKMTGKHAIFGETEIQIRATVLADIKVSKTSEGDPILVVTDCKPIIRDMDITFGLGLLNTVFAAVQGHIREMLGNRLCQSVPSVLEEVNEDFDVSTEKNTFGDDLGVQYTLENLPVITGLYIELDINAEYMLYNQVVEHLNDDQEFTMPAGLGNKDAMINLGLSKDYFSCLFMTYKESRGFDLEIPSTHESLANQMSTSALGAHIPEISSRYPQPLPVDMNIVLSQTPAVIFQNNQLIVQIAPYVEMFVVVSNSPYSYQHLLTVNVGASLLAALYVEEEKLKTSVSLQGSSLCPTGGLWICPSLKKSIYADLRPTEAPTSFHTPTYGLLIYEGHQDPDSNFYCADQDTGLTLEFASISFGKCNCNASLLSEYMLTVFETAYVPHINEILSVGVPLPRMPNIQFIDPVIAIEQDIAVMSCDIRYNE